MAILAPERLLLTHRDVMQLLQVDRDRAYACMHEAGAVRIGRRLRLRPEDLKDYLQRLRELEREPTA